MLHMCNKNTNGKHVKRTSSGLDSVYVLASYEYKVDFV